MTPPAPRGAAMSAPLLPAFVGAPEADRVYHCDALALLRALPDASVDLIVTDPPYGIGYESSRTTRNDGTLRSTPTAFGNDVFDASWIPECHRVLKDGGALYLFTRWDVAHLWHAAIDASGLKTVQRIIWYKAHWKMGDLRYYGSQTEDILFARKGDHCLRWDKRAGNVWYSASALYQGDGYWEHPTQKPLRIVRQPIANSSDPGALVVDPFCGSGTSAVASKMLRRHFICGDTSLEYVEIARRRLAQPYTLPLPLALDAPLPATQPALWPEAQP